MRPPFIHQFGLYICLFKSPQIFWHGQQYLLARWQTQALLYYLAVYLQPMTRSHLCQLFWPQENTAWARRRLTHLLDDLRRSLPSPALLQKTEETVSLNADLVMSDTVAFTQLTTSPTNQSSTLENAVALYQDALLLDFTLPRQPEFEIWLLGERAAWEKRYLAVLARLVEDLAANDQVTQAISYALRYLYTDATNEAMHCALMKLYGRLGDRCAVQRQYAWCVRVLARELRVEPAATTEAVYTAALHRRVFS
ncbi:MAG: BTAD domain-containing putative transcriptional regulator [Caldilineaceae bacterium]